MKKFRKISPRRVKKLLQNYSKTISRAHGALMWFEDHTDNLCKEISRGNKKCNKLQTYLLVCATITIIQFICIICQTIYM